LREDRAVASRPDRRRDVDVPDRHPASDGLLLRRGRRLLRRGGRAIPGRPFRRPREQNPVGEPRAALPARAPGPGRARLSAAPDVRPEMEQRARRLPRGTLSRERILHVAYKLVDDRGLHALSMPSLARELHASSMSIYRHFRDKDDLIDALTGLA